MTNETRQQILKALLALCNKTTPTSWEAMVDAVKASGAKVPKNGWLQVRGVLQYAINTGMLIRTLDVREENYVALTARGAMDAETRRMTPIWAADLCTLDRKLVPKILSDVQATLAVSRDEAKALILVTAANNGTIEAVVSALK